MGISLQQACYDALMEQHVENKCSLVHALYSDFQQEILELDHKIAQKINEPGRPDLPKLVLPKLLKKTRHRLATWSQSFNACDSTY